MTNLLDTWQLLLAPMPAEDAHQSCKLHLRPHSLCPARHACIEIYTNHVCLPHIRSGAPPCRRTVRSAAESDSVARLLRAAAHGCHDRGRRAGFDKGLANPTYRAHYGGLYLGIILLIRNDSEVDVSCCKTKPGANSVAVFFRCSCDKILHHGAAYSLDRRQQSSSGGYILVQHKVYIDTLVEWVQTSIKQRNNETCMFFYSYYLPLGTAALRRKNIDNKSYVGYA